MIRQAFPFAALVALAGCASYPAPVQHMADAQASERGAAEVGATANPQAQLHLKMAQEEIARAQQLMHDGDNKRADYVLVRAQADADLALALSREAQAEASSTAAAQQLAAAQAAPTAPSVSSTTTTSATTTTPRSTTSTTTTTTQGGQR